MIIETQGLEETHERFASRREVRAGHTERITARDWLAVDGPERINERLERTPGEGVASRELRVERLFGANDLVDIAYLEKGVVLARAIALIRTGALDGGKDTGTGFMVSTRLMLTNHHVFPTAERATRSVADFDYQLATDGELRTAVRFEFAPDEFFMTDERLDYSLVAVQSRAADGTNELADFGRVRLSARPGKALVGEPLSIIEHPDGQPKQVAIRENRLVDMLPDHLHYLADTAPGSSGAPVFNNEWEAVALHHSGVARRNAGGAILTKSGDVWKRGEMPEEEIDWIANEGVRISRLLRSVAGKPLARPNWEPLRQDILGSSGARPA